MKMNHAGHIVFAADDFGISPGVNAAILKAYLQGSLQKASIMANMPCFEEAVEMVRQKAKDLQVGLHANLTLGMPLLPAERVSLLVDRRGEFMRDFVGYLVMPWIVNRNILYKQVKDELEQQIIRCLESDLRLQHIDSHRHVHSIPWIFDIVTELADKYRIKEIRIINERLTHTFFLQPTLRFVFNGNLLKFLVLKTLSALHTGRSDSYSFSILHSCGLEQNLVEKIKIPKNFSKIEVILHPGMPEVDRQIDGLPQKERKHLLSDCRSKELEVALRLGRTSRAGVKK